MSFNIRVHGLFICCSRSAPRAIWGVGPGYRRQAPAATDQVIGRLSCTAGAIISTAECKAHKRRELDFQASSWSGTRSPRSVLLRDRLYEPSWSTEPRAEPGHRDRTPHPQIERNQINRYPLHKNGARSPTRHVFPTENLPSLSSYSPAQCKTGIEQPSILTLNLPMRGGMRSPEYDRNSLTEMTGSFECMVPCINTLQRQPPGILSPRT